MSIVGTVTAVGAGAKSLGFDFDSITSIFGGGNRCSSTQKNQRTKLAAAIDENTTRTERQQFIDSNRMENPPDPTGSDMAYFFIGEDDCFHKNVTPGDQQFLDRLEGWLNRKIQENQTVPADPYSNNSEFSSNQSATKKPVESVGGVFGRYWQFFALAAALFWLAQNFSK